MASLVGPAAKRMRLVALSTSKPSICERCIQKRAFASTVYTKQQQQQQRPNPTKPMDAGQTTHFGFSNVAESLKESKGKHNLLNESSQQLTLTSQLALFFPLSPRATTR